MSLGFCFVWGYRLDVNYMICNEFYNEGLQNNYILPWSNLWVCYIQGIIPSRRQMYLITLVLHHETVKLDLMHITARMGMSDCILLS